MPGPYRPPSRPPKRGLSGYRQPTRSQTPKLDKKQARELARSVLDRDRQKAPATIADQEKKYRRMAGMTLDEYCKGRIKSKGSWYAYKAAYQRGLAVDIRDHLNKAEPRSGLPAAERSEHRRQALELSVRLKNLSPDYAKQHQHQDIKSAYNGPKTPRRGHKYRSRRLKKDFRENVLAELKRTKNTHYDAALVSALTGCRPQELVKDSELPKQTQELTGLEKRPGVEIERVGPGEIRATIYSAKVTDVAGHEVRTLYFQTTENPFAAALERSMIERNAAQITVNIKTQGVFYNALTRAGKRCGYRLSTSAYAFRNRLAGDFKATGLNQWDRAVALGHRSVKTAGAYGFAAQGGGHGMSAAEGSAPAPAAGSGPSMG